MYGVAILPLPHILLLAVHSSGGGESLTRTGGLPADVYLYEQLVGRAYLLPYAAVHTHPQDGRTRLRARLFFYPR